MLPFLMLPTLPMVTDPTLTCITKTPQDMKLVSNPSYLQSLVMLESSQTVARVTWTACGVYMLGDIKTSSETYLSSPSFAR